MYKNENASTASSREKRQLLDNEYWLVPVRVCLSPFPSTSRSSRFFRLKVGRELETAIIMNELLPEGIRALSFPGLQGRVYVSAAAGTKVVDTLRTRTWSVPTAYVHRRLYRLSFNESEDIEHLMESRRQLKQEFQVGSWVKIKSMYGFARSTPVSSSVVSVIATIWGSHVLP